MDFENTSHHFCAPEKTFIYCRKTTDDLITPMNVTELARKLKMNKKQLFDTIQSLGFDIGRRAIKIDERQAEKIIQAISDQKKKKSGFRISEQMESEPAPPTGEKKQQTVVIPKKISVKDFADRLHLPIAKVMGELIHNGIMANLNQAIDYDTAAIISEDLGITPTAEDETLSEKTPASFPFHEIIQTIRENEKSEALLRPPVIVVMGHVDHGKTSLLDAIRQTDVASREAGSITQKIGAYQVEVKNRLLTFIDTPGHEAFSSMRSRGARVADIAILVIAADDGIRPQTEEALSMIQSCNLPFLVAINKIDREGANLDQVKKQLVDLNCAPEEWGGKTIVVPVSAKKGTGISELLDMILLVADMEKDHLMANPKGKTMGTIIESHIDKGQGSVATVIIQNGTLINGDLFVVGSVAGKVRALIDYRGQMIAKATPSMPAQILGFKTLPAVGDILQTTTDKRVLRYRPKDERIIADLPSQRIEQSQTAEHENAKTLNIIAKADTLGSLEALISSILMMGNEEVRPKIIHKGLGNITDRDVMNTERDKPVVIGFDVRALPGAEEWCNKNSIPLFTSSIIYEHLEFIKKELQKQLSPESIFKKIGEIKILKVFRQKKDRIIAGGRVISGVVKSHSPIRLLRDGKVMAEGTVEEIQKDKKRVPELGNGSEGGLSLRFPAIIAENDIVEVFEETLKIRVVA